MAMAPPAPSYETTVRLATRPFRDRLRESLEAARIVGPRKIVEGALQTQPEVARGLGEALKRSRQPFAQAAGTAMVTGLDTGRALAKINPRERGAFGVVGEALGAAQESAIRQAQPAARGAATAMFGLPQSDDESKRLQTRAQDATEATSAAAGNQPPRVPGAAVGPETLKTEMAGADTKESSYYDRVKAVKMPNGKIVFTNVPGELVKKGGEYQDYGSAVEKVSGRPWTGGANVFEGAGGTRAYVQPGQERQVAKVLDANSPPPSLEAALPKIDDPQAIFERRDWLGRRAAAESAGRQESAALAKSEAEAQQAVAATQIDPMERARLEAEARYGGEMIQSESEAAKIALSQKLIDNYNREAQRIMQTVPAGPERDAALKRLEDDIKLRLISIHPSAAGGLTRPDPMAAFGAPPAPAAAPAK